MKRKILFYIILMLITWFIGGWLWGSWIPEWDFFMNFYGQLNGTNYGDIAVEFHGLVFDIILLGLVLNIYEYHSEKKAKAKEEEKARDLRIERYRDELNYCRGWKENQAAFKVAGIINQLLKEEIEDIDLSNLHGGQLPQIIGDKGKSLIEKALKEKIRFCSLQGVDLSDANLEEVSLKEMDLQGANLTNAQLFEADLEGANLQGANLEDVDLRKAILIEANLKEVRVEGANFEGTNFIEADLEGVIFRNVNLIDAIMNSANLYKANLDNVNFEGVSLSSCNLEGAKLRNSIFEGNDLEFSNLKNAYLHGAELEEVNLKSAKLEGAALMNAYLKNAILADSELQSSFLLNADLKGADLRGANLDGAILAYAELQGAKAYMGQRKAFSTVMTLDQLNEMEWFEDPMTMKISLGFPPTAHDSLDNETCTGITQKGTRCKNPPIKGQKRCRHHPE